MFLSIGIIALIFIVLNYFNKTFLWLYLGGGGGGLVSKTCPILVSPMEWTVVHPAPLSMGFPRQEYWSGLPFSFSKGSSQLRN